MLARMMKKILKGAWDGDKGPHDAKAKFLNRAAEKEAARAEDIFTILIRALKCFRLSFIALVSLSCLKKKKTLFLSCLPRPD